jgi:hypothetical protein
MHIVSVKYIINLLNADIVCPLRHCLTGISVLPSPIERSFSSQVVQSIKSKSYFTAVLTTRDDQFHG